MAFPPAHLLVGIGVAEVVRTRVPARWQRGWAVSALFSVLPDFDFLLDLALGRPGTLHASWSHSLLALALVGGVANVLVGPRFAAYAAAGYASHIFVDLLDQGVVNLRLGWPFWPAPVPAIVPLLPVVQFWYGGPPAGLLNELFTPERGRELLQQTALGGVIAAGFAALAWTVRGVAALARRRGGRAAE